MGTRSLCDMTHSNESDTIHYMEFDWYPPQVKREREELRGTLLALAESRFSFADDSSPAGQVQLLKNALKRASQYVATLCVPSCP